MHFWLFLVSGCSEYCLVLDCLHRYYDFLLHYTLGSHHSLLIWNLQTGRTLHRLRGHTHDIRALAFVPGGEFVLSGSRDKTLKLWDLRNGQLVEEFQFEKFVRAIECVSNGIVCVGLEGGQICFLRFNDIFSRSGMDYSVHISFSSQNEIYKLAFL